MTLSQWRKKYGAVADSQGWNLFESGLRGLEIQRDDLSALFDTDEDAVDFVCGAAGRGERAAVYALSLIAAQRREPEGV